MHRRDFEEAQMLLAWSNHLDGPGPLLPYKEFKDSWGDDPPLGIGPVETRQLGESPREKG